MCKGCQAAAADRADRALAGLPAGWRRMALMTGVVPGRPALGLCKDKTRSPWATAGCLSLRHAAGWNAVAGVRIVAF